MTFTRVSLTETRKNAKISSRESNTFNHERETDYGHSFDSEKEELAGQEEVLRRTAIKEMRVEKLSTGRDTVVIQLFKSQEQLQRPSHFYLAQKHHEGLY